jgi:thioredoxin 1
MVTELDDNTFEDFVNNNKLVLIDCWAPWCRPCRMLAPVIEALAEEMKGTAAVGKLNTDENQGTAARFGINAIPTMLVFRDGVQYEPLVGLREKEEIKAYLLKVLSWKQK